MIFARIKSFIQEIVTRRVNEVVVAIRSNTATPIVLTSPESIAKKLIYEEYEANLKRSHHLLILAIPYLDPDQIRSVAEDIHAGEPGIAIEFIVQFLTENDRAITRELFDCCHTAMVALGKQTATWYLKSLIRY
jgi:hypothetical protein